MPIGAGTRLIAVGVPRFFGAQFGVAVLEVDEPGRPGHCFAISQTDNGGNAWSWSRPRQWAARQDGSRRPQPRQLQSDLSRGLRIAASL